VKVRGFAFFRWATGADSPPKLLEKTRCSGRFKGLVVRYAYEHRVYVADTNNNVVRVLKPVE
jgi:hypothetical protein